MSSTTPAPNPYDEQANLEAQQRDRLTRTIRLLKRLNEASSAGDPVPPLHEILGMTGLAHPGSDTLATALPALLAAAEAEKEALKRRLRLTRELRSSASVSPPVLDDAARLGRVSARDLDALPYGAILMDDSGRIVAYNDAESRMARLPVDAVIGRNFFTEVAPCTRVKDFEGRFRALASSQGPGVATFDFVFPFPFGPQRVSVILTRHTQPGHVIMALIRR